MSKVSEILTFLVIRASRGGRLPGRRRYQNPLHHQTDVLRFNSTILKFEPQHGSCVETVQWIKQCDSPEVLRYEAR